MKPITGVSILVVGDIMLDKYIYGHVRRVSQEAPVPILDATHISRALGGCGNVVMNLSALGADVKCVATIGIDNNGSRIRGMLDDAGIDYYLFQSDHTTIKTRLIAMPDNAQVARYDSDIVIEDSVAFPMDCLDMFDAIIISDYGKGMITDAMSRRIIDGHDHVFVDPYPARWQSYKNAFAITPNNDEFVVISRLSGLSPYELYDNVLHKIGKAGMVLSCLESRWPIRANSVPVFNVCGAGDTVIAVMAACVSMGLSLYQSACIAQRCAEYVVSQPGTAYVPKSQFQEYLDAA